MIHQPQICIPTLVRIKRGALDRLEASLAANGIEIVGKETVREASLEFAQSIFANLPGRTQAVTGLGRGKVLDITKSVGFLARLPDIWVPTSLSTYAAPPSVPGPYGLTFLGPDLAVTGTASPLQPQETAFLLRITPLNKHGAPAGAGATSATSSYVQLAQSLSDLILVGTAASFAIDVVDVEIHPTGGGGQLRVARRARRPGRGPRSVGD